MQHGYERLVKLHQLNEGCVAMPEVVESPPNKTRPLKRGVFFQDKQFFGRHVKFNLRSFSTEIMGCLGTSGVIASIWSEKCIFWLTIHQLALKDNSKDVDAENLDRSKAQTRKNSAVCSVCKPGECSAQGRCWQ